MELYLIKSAVILTILYGFYKLVLENESMHVFKRFYLLGSLPAAFLIPLVIFTSYVEVPVSPTPVFIGSSLTMPMAAPEVSVNLWPYVIWGLYALGVVFFSVKFGKNLNQLISKIRNNPKFTRDSIHHILLKTPVIPHTFLNYVFLNKQKFEAKEIPEEVIQHEHVHAKQKHSIDILVVELLQIVFWFNPFLYFIKRSIKLNHEFLADRAVLNLGADIATYQKLLLAFSSNASTPALVNSINYSFIKKRLTVMKKQTSTKAVLLRSLLLLPLLVLLVYGFSTQEVVQKQILVKGNEKEDFQKKLTPQMIKEYYIIAKKWNDLKTKDLKIINGEKERALFIYNLMNESQKRDAEIFSNVFSVELQKILTSPDTLKLKSIPPVPPVPPAPAPEPIWYIENLNNEGAIFMFEEKEINYKEAIEIVKKNKSIGINVNRLNKGTPIVTLAGGC